MYVRIMNTAQLLQEGASSSQHVWMDVVYVLFVIRHATGVALCRSTDTSCLATNACLPWYPMSTSDNESSIDKPYLSDERTI